MVDEHATLEEQLQEFRQAFVIAVGDQSPFAKIALRRIDAAIARNQQRVREEMHEQRRKVLDRAIRKVRDLQKQLDKQQENAPIRYHPCTIILVDGLMTLPGGQEILRKWDAERAIVDARLAETDKEEVLVLERMREEYSPHDGPMSARKAKALDAAIQSLTYRSSDPLPPRLADGEVAEVIASMPGGADGYLKDWGWLKFADALFDKWKASPATRVQKLQKPHGHLVQGEQSRLYIPGADRPEFTNINGNDSVKSITALYTERPADPVIHAIFETVDPSPYGATGTTKAPIKRIETNDDGHYTVVIDHWPRSSMPDCVRHNIEENKWRNALVGLYDTDHIDTPEQAIANVKSRMRRLGAQPAASAEPVEMQGVAQVLAKGRGIWRSCTGCHELNEGHDTGPYSKTLECHLGNGCSECGGIGAVWDTTDYQTMADDIARELATPVAAQPTARDEKQHVTPADALYGFMAWMTGRDYEVTLSAHHGATVGVDLAKAFCEANGLEAFSADYPDNLKFPNDCTLSQLSVRMKPAFYIDPKIIDPQDGTIAEGVTTPLTWSHEAIRGHSMPVYVGSAAIQPAEKNHD